MIWQQWLPKAIFIARATFSSYLQILPQFQTFVTSLWRHYDSGYHTSTSYLFPLHQPMPPHQCFLTPSCSFVNIVSRQPTFYPNLRRTWRHCDVTTSLGNHTSRSYLFPFIQPMPSHQWFLLSSCSFVDTVSSRLTFNPNLRRLWRHCDVTTTLCTSRVGPTLFPLANLCHHTNYVSHQDVVL